MQHHPDRQFAEYIITGIAQGFRIGFQYTSHARISAKANHPSANEHPDIISYSLDTEIQKGRLLGPLHPSIHSLIHTSSLGAIPKKHSDKWRLILDLSHPAGHSINDGIEKPACSLTYIRVDEVVQKVLLLGRGCQLAKIDIESAFRNVPVHPQDRHLLGLSWNGNIFIEAVLPFGLRSAPKIFNALADALQWVAEQSGVSYLRHYLDDFITAGKPLSEECQANLDLLIALCNILGFPMASNKREGPTTCLTFLGIEIDTIKFELRLPAEKLTRLKAILHKWARLRSCRKRELQSLVGLLHDASIVITPGRTFLRRLIDLIKSAHHRPSNGFIRLNLEAQSDILWWHTFIEDWNGLSMMQHSRCQHPDIILTLDASGSWGCGAYYGTHWLQYPWSPLTKEYNITAKELLPIVLAAAVWGKKWENKSLLCRCDNEAVVHIINTGTSRDPIAMGLMRCLYFIAAKFKLIVSATHLAGKANTLADALSRNNASHFLSTFSQAPHQRTLIPAALIDLLVGTKPDWTSPSWNRMFSSIFKQPLPKAPCVPTPQATTGIPTSAPSMAINPSPLQRPSSASLLAISDNSNSSTKQSNHTSPAFVSSISSMGEATPSFETCLGYNMSSAVSNPKKRRKVSSHGHDSQ